MYINQLLYSRSIIRKKNQQTSSMVIDNLNHNYIYDAVYSKKYNTNRYYFQFMYNRFSIIYCTPYYTLDYNFGYSWKDIQVCKNDQIV